MGGPLPRNPQRAGKARGAHLSLRVGFKADLTGNCQPAPGSVTWNVTVANTGDLPLVGINVTDSRHGLLGSVGTLDPGLSVYFLINETGLPAGFYTDNATAYGAFQPDSGPYVVISDSGIAECRVGPDFVIPEVPFGTIMVSATMIFALGAFVAFPKLRRKREYPKS